MPDPQFYILFSLSIAVLGICTSDGVPLTVNMMYLPLSFALISWGSVFVQMDFSGCRVGWGEILHILGLVLFVPTLIVSLYTVSLKE